MPVVHSITTDFVANYKAMLNNNTEDVDIGHIKLAESGAQVDADIEVIVAMKTILSIGITRNEKLAKASRKMFLALIKAHPTYITRNRALLALEGNCEGYEEECLFKAISECLGGAFDG